MLVMAAACLEPRIMTYVKYHFVYSIPLSSLKTVEEPP